VRTAERYVARAVLAACARVRLRAAEKPLRSDLDMSAGLKAQVLGRIEELDAWEREREELVASLSLRWRRGGTTR
jgi:hypothetical protein